jgi:hypothetical protein
MLSTLITSKTRIKILIKFFINSNVNGYLRNLESEFGESCNAIRIELNRFEKAGLLRTNLIGNKKMYFANTSHPIFNDIHIFLKKMIGIENLSESILAKIPNLKAAYLTGKLAQGIESQIFDLLLVGDNLDKARINMLIEKYEGSNKRKVRYLILHTNEAPEYLKESSSYLILQKDNDSN